MGVPNATTMSQRFLGLAEISLIGTDTYRFQDKFAFRYHFSSWKAVNREQGLIETDRFYVWADAVDSAYSIAVKHVYRALNEPYQPEVDSGEGGSLFEADYDEQHREIILDNIEDWKCIVEGNRQDLYYS